MAFDPRIAVSRFGTGPSPHHAQPGRADDLVAEAAAGDAYAEGFPFMTSAWLRETFSQAQAKRQLARRAKGTEEGDAALKAARAINDETALRATADFQGLIVRATGLPFGLGERLVAFWSDHFTATGTSAYRQYAPFSLSAEAIRPHIMGSFTDMLRAVARDPLMLYYLDGAASTGPNSRVGMRKRGRGLNENFAREIMELHTLGVEGRYTQRDVRELAELLTGLTLNKRMGFQFNPGLVEPGPEIVLGRVYEGDQIEAIDAVLGDLARHPDTARHLAWKLARHFTSDTPDEGLVRHVAARYAQSDGNLGEATAALLEHPAAWESGQGNVKWPFDFIASSLRALGMTDIEAAALPAQRVRRMLRNPLSAMGQPWQSAPDPAGWDEEDESWVTPQAVAERINWAMRAPQRLLDTLPDPRALLALVAGEDAPPELSFAVNAAETQSEGIGLILASPTFQRR
ncbi:MAG: DUF1800 domain-containing protein [Pseudomonadota bacterium]